MADIASTHRDIPAFTENICTGQGVNVPVCTADMGRISPISEKAPHKIAAGILDNRKLFNGNTPAVIEATCKRTHTPPKESSTPHSGNAYSE